MAKVMTLLGRDPRRGGSDWTIGRRKSDDLEAERQRFEARVQRQADRLRSYQRVQFPR